MEIIDLDAQEAIVVLKYQGDRISLTKAQIVDLLDRGRSNLSHTYVAESPQEALKRFPSARGEVENGNEGVTLAALGKMVSVVLQGAEKNKPLPEQTVSKILSYLQEFDGVIKPRASSKVGLHLRVIQKWRNIDPGLARKIDEFLVSYPQLQVLADKYEQDPTG